MEKDIILGDMKYRKYESKGFRTPSKKFEFYSSMMKKRNRPPMPV